MSLRRTKSPCSPRTPKIQQQNWDDRRKQLLDLGVSTGDNTNESGNSSGIQLHHSPTNQPRIRRYYSRTNRFSLNITFSIDIYFSQYFDQ